MAFVLLYLILAQVWLHMQVVLATSPTKIITDLLENKHYDKFEAPVTVDGGPVLVTFGIYVETMSSPTPSTMDFELGCYIRTQWQDTRLQFNQSVDQLRLNDLEIFERLWQPDIYFPNVKNIKFQTGLIPNFIARIYPNGTIFSSKRYLFLVECPMSLEKYPLDRQTCALRLLSWFSKDYELNYTLFENAIEVNTHMGETEMVLVGFSARYAPKGFIRGSYSGIQVDFQMARKLGHHLIQTFLPTALVVCLSWASFWFDMQAIQARLSICILTLLILSTQASGLRQILPPVSYVKAIDVWIGFCMTMDCLVLLEFSYVNYLTRQGRRAGMKKGHSKASEDHLAKLEKENAGIPLVLNDLPKVPEAPACPELDKYIRIGEQIDKFSRFLFPLTFAIFNIFFWTFYYFS